MLNPKYIEPQINISIKSPEIPPCKIFDIFLTQIYINNPIITKEIVFLINFFIGIPLYEQIVCIIITIASAIIVAQAAPFAPYLGIKV